MIELIGKIMFAIAMMFVIDSGIEEFKNRIQ